MNQIFIRAGMWRSRPCCISGRKVQLPGSKRNLNRELIAVLIIYSLTIWYIVTFQRMYSELAVVRWHLVGGAFLFYYYRKSKLLKQMECVACEVRSNLKQQLGTLEKYVRFYFIAGTILTPLGLFCSRRYHFVQCPRR